MIRNESDVAAVIVEPVPGTNGVIVPPPEYMPRLRRICDDHNVLLIADEVMTGWMRTGRWFAMDHWDVKPDILTTAKGITSAYVPLGLCATTGKIAEFFDDHYFSHGHTYEAHPLTLAPAIAAIEEYRRLNLLEKTQANGKYLGEKLTALQSRHPSIGNVRGLGLFWAVELIKNQKTREPFHTYVDKISRQSLMVDRVSAEMMKNGVYLAPWVSHFVIAPPLIITPDEIDIGVNALDLALAIADQEMV
jgi:taurine--2-oxoglutarate transaminase